MFLLMKLKIRKNKLDGSPIIYSLDELAYSDKIKELMDEKRELEKVNDNNIYTIIEY